MITKSKEKKKSLAQVKDCVASPLVAYKLKGRLVLPLSTFESVLKSLIEKPLMQWNPMQRCQLYLNFPLLDFTTSLCSENKESGRCSAVQQERNAGSFIAEEEVPSAYK